MDTEQHPEPIIIINHSEYKKSILTDNEKAKPEAKLKAEEEPEYQDEDEDEKNLSQTKEELEPFRVIEYNSMEHSITVPFELNKNFFKLFVPILSEEIKNIFQTEYLSNEVAIVLFGSHVLNHHLIHRYHL